jgi:hypothetical protein
MGLGRVRVELWRLMALVAIVACVIGAVLAFWRKPVSATNVITGCVALYGVPVLVIVVRGIPPGRLAKIVWTVAKFGVPVAGLFGLLCFLMSGYVGLIGGFAIAVLMGGWWTLFFVGLFGEAPGV